MPTDQPKRDVWPIYLTILLLVFAYGAAYLWTVEPVEYDVRVNPLQHLYRVPRFPNRTAEVLFMPAFYADTLLIRPRYWGCIGEKSASETEWRRP